MKHVLQTGSDGSGAGRMGGGGGGGEGDEGLRQARKDVEEVLARLKNTGGGKRMEGRFQD